MIRFEKLKNNPHLLKCFTGLNLKAFNQVLPAFRQAYEEALERRDEQREGCGNHKAGIIRKMRN